eukprot:gene23026-27861_t
MGRGYKGKKGGGGRGGKGGGGGKGGNKWNQAGTSGTWTDIVKENKDYEEYYTAQGIIPDGEFHDFLTALQTPLPITFRINGSGKFAFSIRDRLQTDFFAKLNFQDGKLILDGEEVTPPKPLAWYPDDLAWQMAFSRTQLRKCPELEQIFEFIKVSNDYGSITRQEAVSMVPPFFLDVQPHHAGGIGTGEPTGVVVANEVDFKRCSLLTHQVKRANSPAIIVANHDASLFPMLSKDTSDRFQFDRILADVPCSGDGTLRKNTDLWRKWKPWMGNGMHSLQLKIALTSARLLKVGGRLVYSTCSLSPIEDEAVVAELLVQCGGALELVDVADEMTNLKRMPGMRTWLVASLFLLTHPANPSFVNVLKDKFGWQDEYLQDKADKMEKNIVPSMFPSEEKAKLPLERCMRFLPHQQDTGGFFVAVLQKVRELKKLPGDQGAEAEDKEAEPPTKKQKKDQQEAQEKAEDELQQ